MVFEFWGVLSVRYIGFYSWICASCTYPALDFSGPECIVNIIRCCRNPVLNSQMNFILARLQKEINLKFSLFNFAVCLF